MPLRWHGDHGTRKKQRLWPCQFGGRLCQAQPSAAPAMLARIIASSAVVTRGSGPRKHSVPSRWPLLATSGAPTKDLMRGSPWTTTLSRNLQKHSRLNMRWDQAQTSILFGRLAMEPS